jgi:hypothetical protein
MTQREQRSRITRRGFVRGAAIGAGAAVTTTSALRAADSPISGPITLADSGDYRAMVTATIVRADHSSYDAGRLRLGVRTSLRTAEGVRNGRVVVVDDVEFTATPTEIREQVERAVQRSIAAQLSARGTETMPEQVAVRVFGGLG